MASKFSESANDIPEDDTHPFVDCSSRFALDTLLRSRGFRIHSRPKNSQARWEKEGKAYLQSQALAEIKGSEVANALSMRSAYFDQYE